MKLLALLVFFWRYSKGKINGKEAEMKVNEKIH